MFMTIGDDASDGLKVEQPYFQRAEPLTWEDDGSYVDSPEGFAALTHATNHQWNHSLGEIVSSLLAAGLILDSFEEVDHSAWCPWPALMVRDNQGWRLRDDPERMPLQFVLAAHRRHPGPGYPRC
jgi:hypothetical protein